MEKQNFPRLVLLINAVILSLAALSVIASFNASWGLWGIETSRAFPGWVRILLLLILLLAAFPPVSRSTSEFLHKHLISSTKRKPVAMFVILMGAALLLFVLLPSRNHLLGDGYNILGNVAGGMSFSRTEPMEYVLHHVIYLAMGGKGAEHAFRISSCIAGVLFLTALYYFIKDKRKILLAAALAANFAVMQFFFGYVEDYTFSFVLLFIYMMFALRDYETGKASISTLASLILAASFHLISLVMLPSFLYLVWLKYKDNKIVITGSLLLAMSAVVILTVVLNNRIGFSEVFVPLISTGENPYHLFSMAHLKDMLNIFFLNYLVLPLALIAMKGQKDKILFWLFSLLPPLGLIFILDPKISASRDWDLLSIASAPLLSCVIYFMVEKEILKPSRQYLFAILIPLICLGMLHTGGWILGNTRKAPSYAAIKEMVKDDPHYSSAYYKGYRNKSWGRIAWKEFGDIDEVIRVDLVRLQGDPSDSLNIYNLASNYAYKKDTVRAAETIRQNWRRFVDKTGVISNYAAILYSLRYYRDAEEMLRSCIAAGGEDYALFLDLGMIMEATGRTDSALYYGDKSFILNKDAPVGEQLQFYLKAAGLKKYDIAESGLRRIYPRMPAGINPSTKLLIDALVSHDYKAADSLTSILSNSLRSAGK